MTSRKDAAWWREYRARKRPGKEGHAACDRVERELRAEVRVLRARVAELEALGDLGFE